jgi:hypothetical protein
MRTGGEGVSFPTVVQDACMADRVSKRRRFAQALSFVTVVIVGVMWLLSPSGVFGFWIDLAILLTWGRDVLQFWPRLQRRPTDISLLQIDDGPNASVELHRVRRYYEAYHRIPVVIDGVEVARLANNETASLALAPGRHTLSALPSWPVPRPVTLEVEPSGRYRVTITAPNNLQASFSRYFPLERPQWEITIEDQPEIATDPTIT